MQQQLNGARLAGGVRGLLGARPALASQAN